MAEALDTVRHLETPEGVRLELPVAGPMSRGAAFVVDLFVRSMLYAMVGTPLALLGDLGQGLMLLFAFLVEWFYPVIFEVKLNGATPGKVALGLAVVHDDGTPVGWSSSIVRNLLRFADFLPFAWLAGLASMTLHPDFKRLGDLVAGTIVVYRARDGRDLALPAAAVQPVPFALRPDEQRAVIAFAERTEGWTDDRAEELAELLMPIVGGPPRRAVTTLHGMARWLRGER
jgi:uncharacterized RDD family membrane protein YckC